MTLYLWDMANTLFPERWDKELTGFDSFDDYVLDHGVALNDPRGYENMFKEVYTKGEMYNLKVAEGYKEVLEWCKHNEAFSTGLRECMDWRAEYLNPRVGFDIKSYFQEIKSTFDFGETNVKTPEMLEKYITEKQKDGYDTIVYTDDKLKNCELFKMATEKVGVDFRVYNILNDRGGLRKKDWYWEIGDLYDFLENEKSYEK